MAINDRDIKPEYLWPDYSIRPTPPPATSIVDHRRLVTREAKRRAKVQRQERARRGGRYR